ncbi:hypothetical protein Misp01_39500 [Microtetraspora sp. NBRC 13810]|uniref:hypothetical protein n=1 Tax=Microtetraspora sp. NBRC 13810 TaxID=3030990 RepID=UPI002555B20E|nr:hypothetical protein [Microtetraspora sp. NBRC 13810]GLW08820.1 hypothetical protein Misp01_39500 [Microtetraspora sp. NBRC 13810]
MTRRIVAFAVLVGLLGTSGLAVVVSWVRGDGTGPAGSLGCPSDLERLIPGLASLDILDARPDGASADGGRLAGCDTESVYVYVRQDYRFSGDQADVRSFYEEAARDRGWRAVEGLTLPPDQLCFVKPAGDLDLRLSIAPTAGLGLGGGYSLSLAARDLRNVTASDVVALAGIAYSGGGGSASESGPEGPAPVPAFGAAYMDGGGNGVAGALPC